MGASQQAAILTRHLLTSSRQQVREARELDLTTTLGALAKLIPRMVPDDVSVSTRFPSGLPLVHAAPGAIEQVWIGLLVNACEAMPDGGRLLLSLEVVAIDSGYAAAHPAAHVGPCVCLKATDTGVGIPPEKLSRILEPGFATKEMDQGLGYDAIVGLVQQYRGWIDVSSRVGLGTTVRVYFPAARGAAAESRAVAPTLPGRGGGETILVVEDEPIVQRLAVAALQRHGYHVLKASSGVEALQLLDEADGIDLLLTDLTMPGGVSGAELASVLAVRRPLTKIVYTSGQDSAEPNGDAHFVVGKNFLPKPYLVGDLLAIVRNRLDSPVV